MVRSIEESRITKNIAEQFTATMIEESATKSVAKARELKKDHLSRVDVEQDKTVAAISSTPQLAVPNNTSPPPFNMSEAFRGIVELIHGTLQAALQSELKLSNHNRDFGIATLNKTQHALLEQRNLLEKQTKMMEEVAGREKAMKALSIGLIVLTSLATGLSLAGGIAGAVTTLSAKAATAGAIQTVIKTSIERGVQAAMEAAAQAGAKVSIQQSIELGTQVAIEQAMKAGVDAVLHESIKTGVRIGVEKSLQMSIENAIKMGVKAAINHATKSGIEVTGQVAAKGFFPSIKAWLSSPLSQKVKFWTGVGGSVMGTSNFAVQTYFLWINSGLQQELAREQKKVGTAVSEMKEMDGFYRYFTEAVQRQSGLIHEHAGWGSEFIDVAGSFFKAEVAAAQMLSRAI